ncbi:MAG: DNA polymerase I [Anaerolineae bacterium]|nr:DNA polymerase I [Anaerolineae bacterium]
MTRPTLVLIDGHALAYRMFFALPAQGFQTRAGEPTNAVFGFARTLLDLLLDEKPQYLAVSFDQGMSGRDTTYPAYKGTREKMPDDLRSQLDRIRDLVTAFNIPILELAEYEADDVMGSVAPQAEEQGACVRIITGDRDILQLITAHTTVQLPARRGSRTPEVYDLARFREKYAGLEPPQLVEIKGLMGDSSDNIPGVKGVGEKTALKLIGAYGTVAGVYEHLAEIKGALQKKLAAGREDAFLSRDLAQIQYDVPVTLDLAACVAQDYEYEAVAALFRALEFRTLIDRLPGGPTAAASRTVPVGGVQQLSMFDAAEAQAPAINVVVPFEIVDDAEKLAALVMRLESADAIAWDVETTSLDKMQADIVGICLAVDGDTGYYIPVGHIAPNAPTLRGDAGGDQPDLIDGHSPQQLPLDDVITALRPALTDPAIPKYAHNAPFDVVMLRRYGIDVHPVDFDTMVAEWVANPSSHHLSLKKLAESLLDVRMTDIKELIGTGKNQITFDRVPLDHAAPYGAADAAMTFRLVDVLRPELEQQSVAQLYTEIELPLVPIIADMEQAGVLVDVDYLRDLSADLGTRIAALEDEAHAVSGMTEPFKLGSPKQLNEVLFDKLGLPTEGLRKTTHGFSTDAATLDGLRGEHPLVQVILDWRGLSKLKSTYVDALPELVNPHTGRVHTSFNQTGTVTGRLSSANPNLQNIPIRTEEGRRVRRAFIAPEGHKLLAVDYSQVELRILAHYSQDEALLSAFHEGRDIHSATAAAMFHIAAEDVAYEQRSFAKAVNFGLMYGMGAFRLARDSDFTLAEAEAFIEEYFAQFPGVRRYLDESVEQARQQGYLDTLLGRRRYFPALDESSGRKPSFQDRQRAEREAVNMPIQGTAADIIKIAMIDLARALDERGYAARVLLQVHDELVLEVPDAELDAVTPLVIEVMEAAFVLDAPLVADAKVGQNWLEMGRGR